MRKILLLLIYVPLVLGDCAVGEAVTGSLIMATTPTRAVDQNVIRPEEPASVGKVAGKPTKVVPIGMHAPRRSPLVGKELRGERKYGENENAAGYRILCKMDSFPLFLSFSPKRRS